MVRQLAKTFYDLIDADPDYFGLRKLHPQSLTGSCEKLFMFLSYWLGGPRRYEDSFGHPQFRARHSPFLIAIAERGQWMACMTRAMEAAGIDVHLRTQLQTSFANTADWMRNQEG